jgi:hypothetical protein
MSGQNNAQATLVPAQPAMLLIVDRRIRIDEWPLARSVEERRSADVEPSGDDCLVIAPKKRAVAGRVAPPTAQRTGGKLEATKLADVVTLERGTLPAVAWFA